MLRRIVLTPLTALLIAVPVRAADTSPQPAIPVAVPFVLMPTGHFLVSVKLNDKGPFKLIFDTGAPTMLVNNRLAKEAGLKASGGLGFPFGNMGQATIKSLEVGNAKAEKVTAVVMDHPTVRAFSDFFKRDHGPIDGIVGFPFFARFKMTVDYQKKELTFVPNGYQPEDVMQSMMKAIMGAGSTKGKPRMVAAAGQWGIVVGKDSDDEADGVDVRQVFEGSAAAKAGLQSGDRLLTIDGRWTDSVGDTHQAAGFVKPGTPVTVVVKRRGKEVRLTVTPVAGL
jgi:membrane-associated protease RseP (regulator of RpoE activity)